MRFGGPRAVECGVACTRQFLSRTRWRRAPLAGVLCPVRGRVLGGAKGEDGAIPPLFSGDLSRGVDGRVDSEADVDSSSPKVSRRRLSNGEEYGAVVGGFAAFAAGLDRADRGAARGVD